MKDYDSAQAAELHPHIHSEVPSDPALRVKALETLLVEKGLLDSAAVDACVELYQNEVGPRIGGKIVAHAWVDQGFHERLMVNATVAIGELGFGGLATSHLKAVANTEAVQNLVVCTLCSCYPFGILGIPPTWYKLEAYRSRAVRNPRGVLGEFGVYLPGNVRVDVWDSTAELRYLVVPQRPAGTDDLSEDELAELVTRNAMIGTERDLNFPAAEG
jgi:nitrile hydratase